MKQEYDFSKGERGKFFRENAKLDLPVYLDSAGRFPAPLWRRHALRTWPLARQRK